MLDQISEGLFRELDTLFESGVKIINIVGSAPELILRDVLPLYHASREIRPFNPPTKWYRHIIATGIATASSRSHVLGIIELLGLTCKGRFMEILYTGPSSNPDSDKPDYFEIWQAREINLWMLQRHDRMHHKILIVSKFALNMGKWVHSVNAESLIDAVPFMSS